MKNFNLSRTPEIIFGSGKFSDFPGIIGKFGKIFLIITGSSSFERTGLKKKLTDLCSVHDYTFFFEKIPGEPSPQIIDRIVSEYRNKNISAVAAIGGGSVIDAGKAVSAMICETLPLHNFLEGLGNTRPSGKKLPFIAVPTTSGTGSEATKNAVFSEVGSNGFKKSVRHDNYVPEIALVDPELTQSLSYEVTASSGTDALSQLIESYLSSRHNPFCDALALSGIKAASSGLLRLSSGEDLDICHREKMSYAALVSGITLANAGLIVIHGLAGTIGGYFNIPHGTICGLLLAPSLDINLKKLKSINNSYYISRYSDIYSAMTGSASAHTDPASAADDLVRMLYDLKLKLNFPKLSDLIILGESGEKSADEMIIKISESTDIKNNPVELTKNDIRQILEMCN